MIGLTRSDEARTENLLCAARFVIPPSVATKALDSTRRDAKNGEGGERSSEQTVVSRPSIDVANANDRKL